VKQSIFFEGNNRKFTAVDGGIFDPAEKAREVLPWLVRYAEQRETVRYGVLGKAVGVNPHTQLKHILGIIGSALAKSDPHIPMIQLIVINQHGVVGDQGLGWIVPKEKIPTLSLIEKKGLGKVEQQKVFDYHRWGEILARCHLEPLSLGAPLETLLQKAAASIPPPGGGEKEDHRLLKEYVRAYPNCIGLEQRSGLTERLLLSGDRMDVLFESPTELVCVEVKGKNSPEDDILRGIFQCVKYRAVLEAQQIYRNDGKQPVIRVCLVLASDLSEKLRAVAEILKIPVKPNVAVPKSFTPASVAQPDTQRAG